MSVKYLSILALSVFLPFTANTSLADEKQLQSKLVSLSVNSGLTEEDLDLRILFDYTIKPRIQLTFVVEEKNIIKVMEKTLVTNDSKNWRLASDPSVSDDGLSAFFVIEKEGEFLGKLDDTTVEGSIEIQIGTELAPKSFSLLAFDEPFRMDNFVFTMLEDKLKVEGNHKLIKEVTVEYKDIKLESQGSGWTNNHKIYHYKGIGKGAKITFSYWDGFSSKKVHFSKK